MCVHVCACTYACYVVCVSHIMPLTTYIHTHTHTDVIILMLKIGSKPQAIFTHYTMQKPFYGEH